jgi:hypothetical protein
MSYTVGSFIHEWESLFGEMGPNSNITFKFSGAPGAPAMPMMRHGIRSYMYARGRCDMRSAGVIPQLPNLPWAVL